MPNLRPTEILLIVLVVLVLFGAKRLPDLAKSVGKSMKILKSEVKDLRDDEPAAHPPVVVAAPTVVPAPDAVPAPLAVHPPGGAAGSAADDDSDQASLR